MKFNLKNVFLSVGMFVFALGVFGLVSTNKAEAAACTFTTTGLWNVGANWTSCTGATQGGGNIPAALDTITINAGKTVTVNVDANVAGIIIADPAGAVATGIIINTTKTLTNSGSLAYTANTGSADQTITIDGTGALSVATTTTINAPTTLTGSSLLTITGAGTFTPSGALNITGGATAGNVIIDVGAGTLAAGAAINITGSTGGVAEITVDDGIITAGGTVTLAGNATNAKLTSTGDSTITITGGLTDNLGAVILTGTVSTTTALALNGGSININSGTTTIGGATTIANAKVLTVALGATADLDAGAVTGTGTGAIINAGTTRVAAITLDAGGYITNNGTFTASGTIVLGAGATVTNNVGGTFNAGGTFGTGAGIVLNSGTLNLAGATTNALLVTTLTAGTAGTVHYNVVGDQTVKAPTAGYYNLTLSGAGIKTLLAGVDINNILTINTGSTVTLIDNNTVANKLYFGTLFQKKGTWGALAATATNKTNTQFTSGITLHMTATLGKSTSVAEDGTAVTTCGSSYTLVNGVCTTTSTTSTTDTTAPSGTSVSVNAGVSTSSSLSSTLTFTAIDATQMLISNDSDFAGASWETYATSKSWTLTSGDGVKTVYAKFRDAAGNVSVAVSDSITVSGSGTPPVTPTVVCPPGQLFRGSDGARCTSTANLVFCPPGQLFNATNGARCNAVITSGAPGASGYNFGNTTLRNGSRGAAVMELQRFLNAKLNLGLVVDGKLGPKTIAVIKQWQASHGLVVDGLVGPKTKAQMNAEAN